jgi:hypothetical protein
MDKAKYDKYKGKYLQRKNMILQKGGDIDHKLVITKSEAKQIAISYFIPYRVSHSGPDGHAGNTGYLNVNNPTSITITWSGPPIITGDKYLIPKGSTNVTMILAKGTILITNLEYDLKILPLNKIVPYNESDLSSFKIIGGTVVEATKEDRPIITQGISMSRTLLTMPSHEAMLTTQHEDMPNQHEFTIKSYLSNQVEIAYLKPYSEYGLLGEKGGERKYLNINNTNNVTIKWFGFFKNLNIVPKGSTDVNIILPKGTILIGYLKYDLFIAPNNKSVPPPESTLEDFKDIGGVIIGTTPTTLTTPTTITTPTTPTTPTTSSSTSSSTSYSTSSASKSTQELNLTFSKSLIMRWLILKPGIIKPSTQTLKINIPNGIVIKWLGEPYKTSSSTGTVNFMIPIGSKSVTIPTSRGVIIIDSLKYAELHIKSLDTVFENEEYPEGIIILPTSPGFDKLTNDDLAKEVLRNFKNGNLVTHLAKNYDMLHMVMCCMTLITKLLPSPRHIKNYIDTTIIPSDDETNRMLYEIIGYIIDGNKTALSNLPTKYNMYYVLRSFNIFLLHYFKSTYAAIN